MAMMNANNKELMEKIKINTIKMRLKQRQYSTLIQMIVVCLKLN